MRIDERVVAQSMPRDLPPDQVGWFAARQPGIVAFLREWAPGDAYAVTVAGAWRLCAVFEDAAGAPPPRIDHATLERAAETALAEARRRMASRLIARQPAMVAWLDAWLANPPAPLSPAEARDAALALAAVLYALDETVIGRPIPAAR